MSNCDELLADPFGFTDDEWNEAKVADLELENGYLRDAVEVLRTIAQYDGIPLEEEAKAALDRVDAILTR